MKKLLIFAALAALAVSCFDKPMFSPMEIDVKIDKKSELKPSSIFTANDGETITQAADGILFYNTKADGTASLKTSLVPNVETPVAGSLKVAGHELPTGLNQGILLTIGNPDNEPLLLNCTITSNGNECQISDLIITKDRQTVFLCSDTELPAPDSDTKTLLPEPVRGRLSEGFTIENITLTRFREVNSATPCSYKTMSEGGEYEYTIEAEYVSPMIYDEGETITIDRPLTDLNININEELGGLVSKDFKVSVDITSSLPFDITGTISSPDGMEGTLDNVIKAGTVEEPVTTTAVLSVVRESKDSDMLHSAVLHITLTAKKNATVTAEQTLKVHIDKLTTQIL